MLMHYKYHTFSRDCPPPIPLVSRCSKYLYTSHQRVWDKIIADDWGWEAKNATREASGGDLVFQNSPQVRYQQNGFANLSRNSIRIDLFTSSGVSRYVRQWFTLDLWSIIDPQSTRSRKIEKSPFRSRLFVQLWQLFDGNKTCCICVFVSPG